MKHSVTVIPPSAAGQSALDWLRGQGVPVTADCGGRGVCGKCLVEIVAGDFTDEADSNRRCLPGERVRACRARIGPRGGTLRPVLSGAKARVSAPCAGTTPGGNGAPPATAAVDLGTTTLAAAMGGATASCANPQRSFGADVMSRISAAADGHLETMRTLVAAEITSLLRDLAAKTKTRLPLERLVVVSNPAMAHILCGVSPAGLGIHPFTPAFSGERRFPGVELDLPAREIVLPALASAFIGSDVLAGADFLGIGQLEKPAILADIGTNGEILLATGTAFGGRILAASAAAGPALEGAGISCGVGGVPGAICSFTRLAAGRLAHGTIHGAPPVGLCGSGIIDLVAALLDEGALDDTGLLETSPMPIPDAGGLSISQQDIRAFQLAKAAFRAALETLVATAGLDMSAIAHLYLAGGLGFYLNHHSAARTGLIPKALEGRAVAVGNTALAGALRCLDTQNATAGISALASRCEMVDLNESEDFRRAFIAQMAFPP